MAASLSIWTDENIAVLRAGAEAGDSYSIIAKRIGFPCTRNAAIGKASRLGIQRVHLDGPDRGGPRPASKPRSTGFRAVIQARAARSPDKPLPKLREPAAAVDPKPWTERAFGQCAYPVSGEGADTISCCNRTGGETYCKAHKVIVYQPALQSKNFLRGAMWAARAA